MYEKYTEKINFYNSNEYENFLKEKSVLDAKQFLNSAVIYLNYAINTETLYKDIGKKTVSEANQNPFYNCVNILESKYNAHTILNKCALEWFFHVSNAMDCLLQYTNSALNLQIPIKKVKKEIVSDKLNSYPEISQALETLWSDSVIEHIRNIYNYSKHTLDLYGNSDFFDVFNGKRDIIIPKFIYRKKFNNKKPVSEFFEYFKEFLNLYSDVLNHIDKYLQSAKPIPNRWYIDNMRINGHLFENPNTNFNSITLNANFADDGEHAGNYYIKNPLFNLNDTIYIMPIHSKNIGQHLGKLNRIEIKQSGKTIGYIEIDDKEITTSALTYQKYKYIAKKP